MSELSKHEQSAINYLRHAERNYIEEIKNVEWYIISLREKNQKLKELLKEIIDGCAKCSDFDDVDRMFYNFTERKDVQEFLKDV